MTTRILSIDELKAKMLVKEPFTLVETLSSQKFAQGHLPGAINLPPDQVAQLAPTRLPDKNADIVLYCGGFS